MKAKWLFPFLVIAIVGILDSCNDKTTKPDVHTSTFPLNVGNHWRYKATTIRIPYNITSLTDTVITERASCVIGVDTLSDSTITTMFDDTVYSVPGSDTAWIVYRTWFAIQDSKMMDYCLQLITPFGPGHMGYRNPPAIKLDFPLIVGKNWISYNNIIEETVTGHEVIACAGREFSCDIVESDLSSIDPSDGIPIKRWFSDDGLIRFIDRPGVVNISDSNSVVLDSARINYTLELTTINLIH